MESMDYMWMASFLASLILVLGVVIVSWSAIKSYLLNKNFHFLLFSAGILLVTFTFAIVDMSNFMHFHLLSVLAVSAGFSLMVLGLAWKKWQYLFAPLALVPILVSNIPIINIVALPIIFGSVAYLAYKNFCHLFCMSKECKVRDGEKREGREWSLIIALLTLIALHYVFRDAYPDSFIVHFCHYFALGFKILAVVLVYYHILKCTQFNKSEKILFPAMISFVVIITITNFCVSLLLSGYIEGDLMDATGRDASSIKIIAEQRYPNGEFARMVEVRDDRLNDLADEIFAKTGIRPNIFLGDERVAAAPSALGTGRMLGSRLESQAVNETIFQNGEKYVGKVMKAGHVGIASYEPIYNGDKVIGMIGSGKYLDKMYEAQTKLFNLFTIASSIFLTLMVGIMIYAGSGKKKA